MRTCYIAGPMRGYKDFNFPAFFTAEEALQNDYNVLNPAKMDKDIKFDETKSLEDNGFNLSDAVRRDVDAIIKSDIIFLLDGWDKSTGATTEVAIAKWLNKDIYLYPSMEPLKKDEDVLEEALRITSIDRQNSYGPPDQDFQRTAKMWGALLGINISAKQVGLCMIALKLSRATWSDKRDNQVDIAGYARCVQMIIDRR